MIPRLPSSLALAFLLASAACQGPSPTVPEDFRISLDRGPCFGACPVYTLSVFSDGRAVYHGRQFVDVQGQQTITLTAQQTKELVDAVISANFFTLADEYTVPVTDLPSITTAVTLEGRTKSVYHYGTGCGTDLDEAPPGLCDLEARLESIPISNGWVSRR
ncbi:MAG: DUF6438 domain-containing protein [Vicinamibacteria bacterium]